MADRLLGGGEIASDPIQITGNDAAERIHFPAAQTPVLGGDVEQAAVVSGNHKGCHQGFELAELSAEGMFRTGRNEDEFAFFKDISAVVDIDRPFAGDHVDENEILVIEDPPPQIVVPPVAVIKIEPFRDQRRHG